MRPYLDRKCLRCALGAVDDEYHLLFECDATAVIRRSLADDVPAGGSPRACMHELMRCPTLPSGDAHSASFDYAAVRRRALLVHQCLSTADAAHSAHRLT